MRFGAIHVVYISTSSSSIVLLKIIRHDDSIRSLTNVRELGHDTSSSAAFSKDAVLRTQRYQVSSKLLIRDLRMCSDLAECQCIGVIEQQGDTHLRIRQKLKIMMPIIGIGAEASPDICRSC